MSRGSGAAGRTKLIIGVALGFFVLLVALLGPVLGLPDPGRTDLGSRLLPPGRSGHLLGTDQLGRDVLARIVAGSRWSLGIGAVATSLGGTIGIALGIAAAWSGRGARLLAARTIDVGISFPYLVIAVTVVAVVGRGFWSLAFTLGLVSWPTIARVVYAETLGLAEREYVRAARLIGLRPTLVLASHVLPALAPVLLVMAAFLFAEMMISESGLSFLGLGAPLGAASWGTMLADSRQYLGSAPWLMLAPATAIVLAVLAANFTGDGLTGRLRHRDRRTG